MLANIQALIKAPKGQFNSFGKYKYRSCEDIVEAVKPIINPLGYFLTISDEILIIGERYYVKATATISNGNENFSCTAFAREEDSKKGMDAAQVTGAASSYARKYALNGLFAIDDTKDSDSDHYQNTSKEKEIERPKANTNTPILVPLTDEWKSSLIACRTLPELTALYNQNKDQVDGWPELKEAFSKRQHSIKGITIQKVTT
jgi:hypothetical protein